MTKQPSWPSLQLLEFSVGISDLMEARGVTTDAEFAARSGKKTSWISSVLSGNENLTIKSMLALAEALGGTVHIAVTARGERVRWVPDVLAEAERAPDLSMGWPGRSETADTYGKLLKGRFPGRVRTEAGTATTPPAKEANLG